MTFDFEAHTQKAVAEFSTARERYQQFCAMLELILRAALAGVKTHQISARAKSIESFSKKAAKPSSEDPTLPKYQNPLQQITDLAAIRIVVFVLNDLPRVEGIISAQFDRVERTDKGDLLMEQGTVGYRTIHYLVKLKDERTQLLEYQEFAGMIAEVQIRTILQHAWAEIEHDVRYKSDLGVHKELSQRFTALAGLIEIGDREFDKVVELDAERRKRVRELAQINDDASDEPTQISLAEQPTAETSVERVIESSSTERDAHEQRVSPRLLLAEKRYEEAILAYNKLIAMEPTQFAHYLGRARARFLMGDAKGALDDLTRADTLSPNNVLASRVRQLITGEAIERVSRDVDDLTPQLPGIGLVDGSSEIDSPLSQSHSEKTVDSYRPNSVNFLSSLRDGHSALGRGEFEKAISLYEQAEQLGFSPVQTLFNKSMARCVQQRYDLCIHILGKFSPFPGSHLELHVMALYAICKILQGGEVADYLPKLAQNQIALRRTTDYVYARTPFPVLERVLQTSADGRYEKVRGVFAILAASSQ